jgi:hypothetical protein
MLFDTTDLLPNPEIPPPGRPLAPDGARAHRKAKRPLATPPGRSRTYENGLPHPATAIPADTSRWETSEDYRGVRFVVPGTPYRVASDPAGWCWLLQRRRSAGRWDSIKFFARKQRLAAVLRELVPSAAFRAVADKIAALPA